MGTDDPPRSLKGAVHMVGMTITFDEAQHPRGAAGKFSAKTTGAPTGSLALPSPSDTSALASYGIGEDEWMNPNSDPISVFKNRPALAIEGGADEWGMRYATATSPVRDAEPLTIYEHHEEFDPHDYAWEEDGEQRTGTAEDAGRMVDLMYAGYTPDDAFQARRGAIAAALWSEVDDEGEPLDARFDADDLSEDFAKSIEKETSQFLIDNANDIARAREQGYDMDDLGLDIWLTRNGHGTGLWDRGLGEVGDRLSAAAQGLGERHLFVDDNGKVDGE